MRLTKDDMMRRYMMAFQGANLDKRKLINVRTSMYVSLHLSQKKKLLYSLCDAHLSFLSFDSTLVALIRLRSEAK